MNANDFQFKNQSCCSLLYKNMMAYSHLIGSKLHPGFSFHKGGIYLHNDRFYGIGTAPALMRHTEKLMITFPSLFEGKKSSS